ncbi:hypothetical protein ABEB36_010146 [Hypothenemus hampei]|uniref:Uncharacterized protein n=1 Tax=Hypothenemus hampei TaxID=57062 RepID=A0ABD1EJ58_HYPHA
MSKLSMVLTPPTLLDAIIFSPANSSWKKEILLFNRTTRPASPKSLPYGEPLWSLTNVKDDWRFTGPLCVNWARSGTQGARYYWLILKIKLQRRVNQNVSLSMKNGAVINKRFIQDHIGIHKSNSHRLNPMDGFFSSKSSCHANNYHCTRSGCVTALAPAGTMKGLTDERTSRSLNPSGI